MVPPRITRTALLLVIVAAASRWSPCACAFQASRRSNALSPRPRCHRTASASASASAAVAPAAPLCRADATSTGGDESDDSNLGHATNLNGAEMSRRDALASSPLLAAVLALAAVQPPRAARADIEGVATPTISDAPATKIDPSKSGEGGGVTMYQTKSGLKYIELSVGSGPSPRYGQLVSISYKAYVKLPDIKGKASKLEEFDSDSGYLVKHGNGRTVPGLDEGLHTMKVGGKRRIIVPAKLGYVQSGLGPIPESPIGRFQLNRLLDRMIEVKGGNVVFDVTMRSCLDDEADQGYYEDGSLSPEDFETLRTNLQQAGIEARASSFKGVQAGDAM